MLSHLDEAFPLRLLILFFVYESQNWKYGNFYRFLTLKHFYTQNRQPYSSIVQYSIVKDELIQFKDKIS